MKKQKSFIMKKKFIIIVAIVLLLLIIGGYWYYKERSFSKAVLRLEILGHDTVQMGEEVTYTVRYKNNSNFTLQEPKLTFEYPEYAINDDGKTRISKDLGDIYPGDEQTMQFKARLLGKEGDLKTAKASLSYKPQNLKARYESNTTFTSRIGSVPITLDFDLPSKLETGREIQFSVNYFSNIDYSLTGLKLTVTYPDKFSFVMATPQPLEKSDWDIASLDKAQGGRVKITGDLSEAVGKKIQFSAKLGIWKDGEFILLKEATKEVEIIEPLIYISQQINGSSNYIANPGETLHYEIYFRNIGNSPFENLFLTNRLDSSIFNLATIKVDPKLAKISGNVITWDWKQVEQLRSLGVQEEGKVEFDVTLNCCWQPVVEDSNNYFATNEVNVSQITQDFQTKVSSKLVILQRGLYSDTTLGNSGPIPPAVGQTTTYTIVWQAKNFYNDVKNLKVRATLPEGVSLTGRISPDTETSKFFFDSASREIIWNVSDFMVAGTGVLNPPPNIMFQVSLSPNLGQKGKVVPIINEATITAEDQATGLTVTGNSPLVDTTLPDDTMVNNHSGIVQ